MIDIFIPSYKRAKNIKTAQYFILLGYPSDKIHVIVDNETPDLDEYKTECERMGINLHVFNLKKSRKDFDFVHRQSLSRRSAGMSRNQFYDIAKKLNIDFYCVIDDDTKHYQIRPFSVYIGGAELEHFEKVFTAIKEFMIKRRIGLFGLSQTGDMFKVPDESILRRKVMNTTFINTKYIYKGERAIQDNDTSQFVGVYNEGLFTGSLASGLVLNQEPSATQKGGLTELYNELKLLNKSLIIPIQFPSFCYAEKQNKNGGRLHHKIISRYLVPKVLKMSEKDRNNIAWDTYSEDKIFTNKAVTKNRYYE